MSLCRERSGFEGHFSVLAIDYKGECTCMHGERRTRTPCVDTETRIFVLILTGRAHLISVMFAGLTERKVSPGALARLNVQEVSRE